MMEFAAGNSIIRLICGDITKIKVDAIVNAANPELRGGGGVDGAIHRAGGPSILLELGRVRPRGGCPPGSAVVTGAGNLPAKYVIHAVGPVWRGGGFGENEILVRAYRSSLDLAVEKRAARVSFPSISTGVYGYPVGKAAAEALGAIVRYSREREAAPREIIFVLFSQEVLGAYSRALDFIR